MTDVRSRVTQPVRPSLALGFAVQCRVIGAIMMRELHTRYGRDNIGYLWVILEPMLYGGAIALMHGMQTGSASGHGGMNPIAMGVTGYSIFIIWRGIISRSDSALTSNISLLQHRMVTILDIIIARNLLELVGCFSAFTMLAIVIHALGLFELPERPLFLLLGIFYVFWLSSAVGMIVAGLAYERPIVERFVHPATYFSMPISGAFFMVSWLPESARSVMLWNPMVHAFETVRYGTYVNCTLEYVDFLYLTGCCLFLTLLGLMSISVVKNRLVA